MLCHEYANKISMIKQINKINILPAKYQRVHIVVVCVSILMMLYRCHHCLHHW